jgi:hypothetical protein
MNAFCDHLFNLRDQALEDAVRARDDLTLILEECEDPEVRSGDGTGRARPAIRALVSC